MRFWVRNDLVGRSATTFRLPLASGWFYPDFVAVLSDGRMLVLEYKGAHLVNDPQTRQKDNVGALWEAKSRGKGLFLIAEQQKDGLSVAEQIRRKIA